MKAFAKRAKKTVVGALGLGALLVSSGVLDDQAEAIVSGVIAVATALGIYQAKNVPASGTHTGGTAHV